MACSKHHWQHPTPYICYYVRFYCPLLLFTRNTYVVISSQTYWKYVKWGTPNVKILSGWIHHSVLQDKCCWFVSKHSFHFYLRNCLSNISFFIFKFLYCRVINQHYFFHLLHTFCHVRNCKTQCWQRSRKVLYRLRVQAKVAEDLKQSWENVRQAMATHHNKEGKGVLGCHSDNSGAGMSDVQYNAGGGKRIRKLSYDRLRACAETTA